MTKRNRLFLFVTALFLSMIVLMGIIEYRSGVSILEQTAKEKLQQTRLFKSQELQKDFAYLNDSLLDTAENTNLKKFLLRSPQEQEQIKTWIRSHGSEGTWRSLIVQSQKIQNPDLFRVLGQMSPTANFLQARFLQTSLERNIELKNLSLPTNTQGLNYFKSYQSIHPSMLKLMERFSLGDILLVDSQGRVVYTVQKGLDFGANLVSGTFSNSRLGQAYRWSLNSSEGDTKFFDFAPLAHFWPLPVGFLATPLFEKGKLLGTLLYQIPLERIENLLSHNHDWEAMGLQKTGEVIAFGSEGLMRNNSRLFLENPNLFLQNYQKHYGLSGNTELVRRNKSTALNFGLSKEDLKRYSENREVEESANDYVGTPSLQSVGRVVLPGNTEWILVAKMNTSEALAPLNRKILSLVLISLFLTVSAFGAIYVFASIFFAPIRGMNLKLQELLNLGAAQKIPPTNGDFKYLVKNFNDLLDSYTKNKRDKDFLESTLQSIREGFFVIEIDTTDPERVGYIIRDLNPAASNMVGIAAASLRGTDLQMWIETDYSKMLSSLTNYDKNNELASGEGVLKKISGEKIPLDLSWAPFSNTQTKPTVVIVSRDIRWKKEIEKKLKVKEDLLKESQSLSKTGSFRWDIQTGKCLWSEEEYNIFGINPNVNPTYDLFRALIFPDDLAFFDQALQTAHNTSLPFKVDLRMKKRDTGELIWIRAQGRTEYDDYGNPVYTYGTTQDITELRRVEQSLIATKNDALKSSQAKSEFLARMSHEIRTPMNAIMGMADLLKETKLDTDQKHYVTIFCKAGEVLMTLINDILDLSKIEAGEVSIENIPFDLQKLLIDVEDMMKPRAQEKGIRYSFEVTSGISPYLMGDPTKLRQVLINLVSNSLKFTESGYIRVAVGKNPSKKDTLMISVSDSGVGIPHSKQHLIFQKFSQADSSITRRFGGTGLGLAISKSLVELMGGQIWFKSRESIGTTFFFTLPYREQVYNPVTRQPLYMHTPELDFVPYRPRDPNKKIRILIADDTEDNRTLFNHYLKGEQYEIIEAENGLEAVDKIKSDKFDIVFMDVQMPEMDGYAATDSIRKWEEENHKDRTPIIALTAHALSEDRRKSLQAGCDDHIAKPFKKDTLLGVINRYSL